MALPERQAGGTGRNAGANILERMRTAFIQTISELVAKDKNVWLVTGDLGFSVFEDFKERFPDQYLNVGVAEQNMMGVSAGLALAGKKVFAYSITTFASMRAYEQIRNDICYQNLPVFVIGGGSTFSYSTFGCTHMPFEDLAILRALPNMAVTSPGDPHEVRELIGALYERGKPGYMRIAKRGEPTVHISGSRVELGKMSELHAGNNATIIVTGRQLPNALEAAELLTKQGIATKVLSAHTIKPIDEQAILKAAQETKAIITVEEHSIIGGLGGAVAEVLARHGAVLPLTMLGITDEFTKGVGMQEYFLERYHLTPTGIAQAVQAALTHHG